MKHSIALAALIVASLGLTALPAMAQDTTTPVAQKGDRQIHRMVQRDGQGPGRGAGIIGLACSEKGAEALEIAFVRWSHRLELTAEQRPLFDALKANALTTQTSFADACEAAKPATAADAKPDLLDSLKSGLKIEEARLTAMTALLPDFEALYASLTDAQKALLMPQGMGKNMGKGFGKDHGQAHGKSLRDGKGERSDRGLARPDAGDRTERGSARPDAGDRNAPGRDMRPAAPGR